MKELAAKKKSGAQKKEEKQEPLEEEMPEEEAPGAGKKEPKPGETDSLTLEGRTGDRGYTGGPGLKSKSTGIWSTVCPDKSSRIISVSLLASPANYQKLTLR
ncbi:hypothetical protein KUCAC02_036637 [Chaenocephalus aceratus]|nr:hypothetical protein KUCAC02_036637 [Chaenocephalus aceratus]